jgi:lipid A 3-O-deacylase
MKLFSITVLALIFNAAANAAGVEIDDPALLSFAVGSYDINRQRDEGTEFRVEYRPDRQFGIFKPFVAGAYTSTSQGFVGAGILIDYYLDQHYVITSSLAPHYYWGENSDLDLGHDIEFRSQLELAYRFENRSRLGLAISHYSNAGLGDQNPGTETASVYYSFPFE